MFNPREAIGFCSDRTESGYSWTLTTLMGELLVEAQHRYGKRDHDWTPLGIEFGGSTPRIWFPGGRNHVSIVLTDSARHDPKRAAFQLAHEVVHLLAPAIGAQAPVIEEGIATIFQHDMSKQFDFGWSDDDAAYTYAAEKVRRLLRLYPDAIPLLREKEKSFFRFTPNLITTLFADVPVDLANDLCEPFPSVQSRITSS